MSRRAVLATVAAVVVLGGTAAPALAAPSALDPLDPSQHCVLTHYDKETGKREGFCVWLPVGGSPWDSVAD